MDSEIKNKIDLFFAQYRKQQYKKGQILIMADDDPAGIFYLKNGIVRTYYLTKQGNENVVNIYKSPSFFPMMWAIGQVPNEYYYEAMTLVEVSRAPKEDVVAFVKNNPDVLYDLLQRTYRGMNGLLHRMVYLMSGNARSRLITELVISAKRFGIQNKNDASIQIKWAQKDIALQAGLTRETVSREMKNLENKELISYEKGVISVLDVKKLEKELESSLST